MTNKQVARILKETAVLIDITGGNSFRAKAFENAGRTIERLEQPVAELAEAGTLTDVKGIGAGLAAQIREILESGSFRVRDEMLGAVPAGVLDLLRVKGLGAKRVRMLWQDLGIDSIDELEDAARTGRLAELEGFGAKTQEKILKEIGLARQYSGRRRYADAYRVALSLRNALDKLPSVEAVEFSGEIRRRLDTVSAIDLTVASSDQDVVSKTLEPLVGAMETVPDQDEIVLTGTLSDGLSLRVVVTSAERFGTVLWRSTGTAEHCAAFEETYGSPDALADEAEVYARVGLPFIEPELREHSGELEAAAAGTLPNLIDPDDLRGTLHNHSTYSDGTHTLEQMIGRARDMGLEYFGLCDHSRSLAIANGLPIERVQEQQEEVRRLNERMASDGGMPFRIFSGTESDILADGSLDYPDDVLASFDLIVASVHQGFNMTREEATKRLIRAIENPYTTILGHATGRLLLSREGYPIDHERVIDACAANAVSIELNANPWRLDMDWRWIRRATERGVLISINPDAHAMDELQNTYWGVLVARKGWLTKEQCLNTKPLHEFEAWLDARRSARP